jgi:hypothetical protein
MVMMVVVVTLMMMMMVLGLRGGAMAGRLHERRVHGTDARKKGKEEDAVGPGNSLSTWSTCRRAAFGECPWLGADDLAFTVGPEVGHHADDVVESRVGTLVDEEGTQCAQWVHDQACLDGAVQSSAGDEREWVFHGDATESKDQVHDLQDGEGLDGTVEVLCEEVPEDLWPEEGLESGSDLVSSSRHDDEASPVVLD